MSRVELGGTSRRRILLGTLLRRWLGLAMGADFHRSLRSPTDQIKDALTNEPLLAYKVSGVIVPAQGSLKTGLYRAVAFGPAAATVGDFDIFNK